jgi:hypothetical protein
LETYRLTGEAVMNNRAYCGETKAVFEVPAVGHEVVVTRWDGPEDEEGTVVAIYRTITPKLIHEVEAMD